jgi:hypothetical protein
MPVVIRDSGMMWNEDGVRTVQNNTWNGMHARASDINLVALL